MWQLTTEEAVFTNDALQLCLNPTAPQDGAKLTLQGGVVASPKLWAWSPVGQPAPRVQDAYIRGADLVIEYGPHEGFPFHTQVYWRCEQEAAQTDISLVVSIRTHKLDTHPVYQVESRFDAAVMTPLDESAFLGTLVTSPERDWSAVETIQPGDLGAAAAPELEASACESRWRLFDLFMEKGVIRRAMLSLAVGPGELAAPRAREVASRLRAAPTPLST
ncbi:hypothetical protein Pla123a_36230 [Posidoniimonas polymericola]|uniref:Uncharacterized protein n=1 Tax=Posidoniimonas polymericola TaxID=2528002 RepID=A0A5C5YEF9_9BACT|nr:hypothetical protein [Posidoniimonas polymericola]TWT73730.1 hypothetical protein Pla123a_36230 [Posidoniimonas polymericola]